ncbi:MAG: hypothetical protein JW726_13075 [Anaerolineales bacterium]|nr:hypothetical protein [Anaerolineales bacterium]
MSQTFNCPNCNAPLDAPSAGVSTVRCPYCNSSVIVPDALRDDHAEPVVFSLDRLPEMQGLLQQPELERLKEIADLIRARNKIGAIKVWRETFNTGLKESKEAVDALERGEVVSLSGMAFLKPGTVSVVKTSATLSPEVEERVLALLHTGNKIEAVKAVREATQWGLQESKNAVDALEAAQNSRRFAQSRVYVGAPASIPLSPVNAKQVRTGAGVTVGATGCFVVGLVVFILAVTLIPIFFAFTSTGGPLADWWAQTNPFAANPIVLKFGGEGTGPGLFQDARHIGVDNQGHIFVAEYEGGKVQVFDMEGTYLTQWTAQGEGDIYMTGFAVDRNSVVYVVTGGTLSLYDGMTGNLLSVAERPEGWWYESVVVGLDGKVVANDADNIAFLTSNGRVEQTIPAAISSVTGDSELDAKVARDGVGNLFILGIFNEAVFRYSPEGRYLSSFGSGGDEEGQFRAPYMIIVDNQSRVYVSDIDGIEVFEVDGRYVETRPSNGFVYGMTFDDQGQLYTVTYGGQVTVFGTKK